MGRGRRAARIGRRIESTGEPGAARVWMVAHAAAGLVLPALAVDGVVGPYVDPKAWLLALLAGTAGVAWVVARGRSGALAPSPVPDRMARVFRAVVLAYLGWWALATAVSIAPGLSVWGDFSRALGLVTVASAVALGALVWSMGPSGRGVRPVVDLILLGSVPVCVLALGQAVGWDVLPQSQHDPAMATLRVRSTLGTHIFLGSYLGLVAPLTAARLTWAIQEAGTIPTRTPGPRPHPRPLVLGILWGVGVPAVAALADIWSPAAWMLVPAGLAVAVAWTRAPESEPTDPGRRLVVFLLTGLLIGQVMVALLTRARGPFLGLVVGLAVASLGLLGARPRRLPLVAGGAALTLVVTFLVLLNLPDSPLAPLRNRPALSRFARLTETRPSSPGWVRLQVWGGVLAGWGRQMGGEPVLPGSSPLLRSLVGYGPETQMMTIEPLARPRLRTARRTAGDRWIQYFIDRAHNDPLDHLLAGGVGGLTLWLAVVMALLALGVVRITGSAPGPEQTLRIGALGAVTGHLVETQFGIETPVSRALFALMAGLLTMPRWKRAPSPGAEPPPRPIGRILAVSACVAAALGAAGSTGWLLASAAYTRGSRAWAAGDAAAAHHAFEQASDRAPWLARPTEAVAEVDLSLASGDPDPRRRLELLRAAEDALARASADHWALLGQVAHAQAMAGVPGKIGSAVDAYTEAVRLRAGDGPVNALRALALLDAGHTAAARDAAERAIALDGSAWLPWAVLARSARDLGDAARADEATARARALAPPGARSLLDRLLG